MSARGSADDSATKTTTLRSTGTASSSSLRNPTTSATTTSAAGSTSSRLTAGARCTIAQDVDIRGTVHIGDGTIVHPKAVIHALDPQGSIIIGAQCIIEEFVQIIHRGKGIMQIGNNNLFEVGARIEAQSIGSHNVFSCKSRTSDAVCVQDFTTIGVACLAQPPLEWILAASTTIEQQQQQQQQHAQPESTETTAQAEKDIEKDDESAKQTYTFPSRTVIYGEQSDVRQWSGNGVRQADALHAKHLDHLRRNIPEFHKLRII